MVVIWFYCLGGFDFVWCCDLVVMVSDLGCLL